MVTQYYGQTEITAILPRIIVCMILPTVIAGAIVLTVLLLVRRRKRQRRIRSTAEEVVLKRSMGEVLKTHRIACKMTQEFVAERMGVSRQTVSKWETGINEPSTSNLLQLAKLFHVSAEELLDQIQF